MSGKHKFFILILMAALFFCLPGANATHIVGGDMTYRCLGNNEYEITLTFTRDCEYGADDAQFDTYAIVAIYDQYYNPVNLAASGLVSIPYVGDEIIDTDLENDCEIMGYEVCVHQSVYRDTIHLFPKEGGYIFAYQRCCRNSTLLNVADPLETGSTQMIHLTEEALDACNTSPTFNSWPEIYVCNNKSVDIDQSATDPDGDELVYKLLTPYQGASVANPRPDRFAEFDAPYTLVEWADGFSENNMLGGSVPLSIDPSTGLLTGIPDQEGQYLVGIMVEEYRDGKLLSTVRRDFELNVRVCLDPPLADFIAPDALCGSDEFEVSFINTSQFADGWYWQFDYPSIDADKISTEENPTYIYPNDPTFSGKDTFRVMLTAIRTVDGCADSTYKDIIVIEDALYPDFEVNIEDCPEDSLDLHFKDLSVDLNPLYTIEEWIWEITLTDGSVIVGSGKDFYLTIVKQDIIHVKLTISTSEGCDASVEREEEIIYVKLDFIANPVVVCLGDSSNLVANPNSLWTYTWDPEEGLYFEDPNDKSDPVCYIDHDTTYYVTVTDGICTLVDSVDVIVKDILDISILGPTTICEDSVTLIALGGEAGLTIFEWSDNPDFNTILATGDTVTFFMDEDEKTFYVRVKDGTGCFDGVVAHTVSNSSIDVDYPDTTVQYCFGLEEDIFITNNRPGDTLIFTWTASPYIISALDTNFVTIYSSEAGEFDLIFHVINQFGCELTDTIHVQSNEGPPLTIEETLECDTYTYCFEAFGGEGADYSWDFGDLTTEDDVSNEVNPCYDYPAAGTYTVTVTATIPECGGEVTLEKEITVPEAFELIGQDTVVFCFGETLMLSVNPSNFSMDVTWYNINGDTIGQGIMIEYYTEQDEDIYIVGIDTFGCVDTLNMFLDLFEFDISQDNPDVLCEGDTIVLSVYNNSTDPLSYAWEDNATIISGLNESSITVVLDDDDDYVVTITSDEYGCETTRTISVIVSDIEVDGIDAYAEYLDADTTEIALTKFIDLTVVGNFDEFATILWSTGETSETITVEGVTAGEFEYCVTVTDEYGCTDEACIIITVWDPPCNEEDIFIPNAFSPNDSDNIPDNNDLFRPRGRFLEFVDMTIYDRWGEEIFHDFSRINPDLDPVSVFWDGTYKGQFLGPDAYGYVIKIRCQDQDNYEAVGNINIIKW